MMISDAVLDDLLEEARRVTADVCRFGVRWKLYAAKIEEHGTPEQKDRWDKTCSELSDALDVLA